MDDLKQRMLASSGARALEQAWYALARDWLETVDTRDDVLVLCSGLHDIKTHAVSKALTVWNETHDRVRVLPLEIQERCFAPLDISEKCRLSLVCSRWRSNVATKLPAMWNDLNLCGWNGNIAAVLARSGGLPLDLILDSDRASDAVRKDRAIRQHAHRIRRLSMTFRDAEDGTIPTLRYAVPRLEDLRLTNLERLVEMDFVSPQLFDQRAPCLRTTYFRSVTLPSSCPALSRVTTATIAHCRGGLQYVFDLMPALENLAVTFSGESPNLPSLPRRAPLLSLDLTDCWVTFDELDRLGYGRVRTLTLTVSEARRFRHSAGSLSAYSPTLSLGIRGTLTLVPHIPYRTVRLVAHPRDIAQLQDSLCAAGPATSHVVQLVLDASFSPAYFPFEKTLLEPGTRASFPGVRTLVLQCRRDPRGFYPLLVPGVLGGAIHAPALTRVEIVRVGVAPVPPVDAADLALFIEAGLQCDDRGALELVVDTEHGIRISGDLDQLRNCVGELRM
ncbi:hypothetical protein AURDEDRAFT_183012 [Auricularia subglabra TFB-10046 SS5]|nr:hypothetical protein AURDEDRAFT_183012 [Auricularia subglabra TFB-10046 SS5]